MTTTKSKRNVIISKTKRVIRRERNLITKTSKIRNQRTVNRNNIYENERNGPLGEVYWEVTISKVINSIKTSKEKVNRP